jgi:hypothetical protein
MLLNFRDRTPKRTDRAAFKQMEISFPFLFSVHERYLVVLLTEAF